MRRIGFVVALFVLVVVVRPSPLVAASDAQTSAPQSAVSSILRAAVVDPSGAAIAGALVTAVPAQGGSSSETYTDNQGHFALLLSPGTYTISIGAPGFAEAVQIIRTADLGSDAREFVLNIANARDAVTVTAPADYQAPVIRTATKTPTPLRDVPQSITVVTGQQMKDQLMLSLGDVVRYVPGAAAHQGENNRDEVILRGNNSSANFFVDGVRDDVQYYRDLYNLEQVEVLKGPNALIFGRGGAGGVVNRVTKTAAFGTFRNVVLEGGAFGHKRASTDLNAALSSTMAVRLNAVYESSDSFRSHVGLERYGASPTLTFVPNRQTTVTVGYEHWHDNRVADRGITSFHGRPVDVPVGTYYGDPDASDVRADVNLTNATIEHRVGPVTIRNHTLFGAYDRGYQNFVPGAVSADAGRVTLTSYRNATRRHNLFNQTDLTVSATTGPVHHTFLAGAEAGQQLSDNLRNTGYFNDATTSIQVPFAAPTVSVPVTFRQSATDADNHVRTLVAAAYAQDQLGLSTYIQIVAGLRIDRFDLEYHNNRNGAALARVDTLVSPRAGLVVKPIEPLSLYGSYSVSHLPSSGDQFSSLTSVTQQAEPEKFSNYEVGAKWDPTPGLSVTTAAYRLDRTNTRATDPNNPARIVQTGSQRTNGYEAGVNGRLTSAWSVAGGYAFQRAYVTSATTAAKVGATVGQVPRHTVSLWNLYQVRPKLSVGLGVVSRTDMFATIDNSVTLPGYVRVDAAAYWSVTNATRLQINMENVLNKGYFLNSDSNTNISPGSPRALRVALMTGF
jgi:catecholate siderophore receptor